MAKDFEEILVILPKVSGGISFVCSFLIVYIILADANAKLSHIYQRLLLGLSLSDLVASLNFVLAGWTAYHSKASCSMNGFLIQFTVVTALYYASLCIQFLLTVVYQWTPRRFKESRVEVLMHGISIGWPISFGIAALATRAYARIQILPGMCHFSYYPQGEDGGRSDTIFWLEQLGSSLPLVVSTLAILYSMLRICWHILQQERRQRAHNFQHQQQQEQEQMENQGQPLRWRMRRRMSEFIRGSFTNNTNENNHIMPASFHRSREASKQAALFIVAALSTYTPGIVAAILSGVIPYESSQNRVLLCMIYIMVPLQGLWNLLIYIRPRYRSTRSKYPNMGLCSVLRMAACQKAKTTTRKRGRNHQQVQSHHDEFSSQMLEPGQHSSTNCRNNINSTFEEKVEEGHAISPFDLDTTSVNVDCNFENPEEETSEETAGNGATEHTPEETARNVDIAQQVA